MMPNNELDTLCYIREQTSFTEDYQNNFGYEMHDMGNRFYLIFDAVLHSFGVMNRNHRSYDQKNIWDCIQHDDYIQSMLRQNSWIGEIDHPSAKMKGEELTIARISNPDMERSSHYIRKPRMEGNLLIGTIQTDSSTDAGMNMAIKIVDGKIIPCFSARVLGALTNVNGRPVVNVKKLVTYDWVLYPSHAEAQARINQPIIESTNDIESDIGTTIIFLPELAKMAAASSKETNWLCESFDLTLDDVIGVTATGNSVVINESGNTLIQPLTDKNIRNKTKAILNDWLHS